MYTNYIFDLYGTLIDIETDEKSELLWNKLSLFFRFNGANYSTKELQQLYLYKAKKIAQTIKETNYPDFEINDIFKSLYVDKFIYPSDELIKNTAQFFRILSIKHLKLYDGAKELLKKIKSKNKHIYLLSNAQRSFTVYELQTLGIMNYFDSIFLSSDYRVCKPDYKFYNKLIHEKNIKIKESIMIGNDPVCDIQGANAIGLDTLYIQSNQSPKINLDDINSTFKLDYTQYNEISKLIL